MENGTSSQATRATTASREHLGHISGQRGALPNKDTSGGGTEQVLVFFAISFGFSCWGSQISHQFQACDGIQTALRNSGSPWKGRQEKEAHRAVSSGCPTSPWEKSKESICTGTPDLGRSYFPGLEYLFLPGFRAIRAILSIILKHKASGHPSMFFLLCCTVHTQYCSTFPIPQVCPGCQHLRAEQEVVTAQFQIALIPQQPRLPLIPNAISIILQSFPLCPTYPIPPELPPHFTYLAEVQSHCSQAILSTKSAICFPSKEDLCVPKILPVFPPFHYVSWSNKTLALLSNHASLSRLFKMTLPPVNRTSCSDNSCISPFIRIA